MTLADFTLLGLVLLVWGAVCAYVGREFGITKGWNDRGELLGRKARDSDEATGT